MMAWTTRCAVVNERVAQRNVEVAESNYRFIQSFASRTTSGQPTTTDDRSADRGD
jgi:hypothetical protein